MPNRPSIVKRKTGRPCSRARRSAERMSGAQPIRSIRRSSAVGCKAATRSSIQAHSRSVAGPAPAEQGEEGRQDGPREARVMALNSSVEVLCR